MPRASRKLARAGEPRGASTCNREPFLKNIRFALAALAIGLPAAGFAQANLAAATYIGVELGTGKVNHRELEKQLRETSPA